jgi:predicted cupin superfamily sugar epimerase
MLSAQQVIDRLKLVPLTIEGGFFRETYRSNLTIPAAVLPEVYGSERNASTAIYYLLTHNTSSAIHRVKSDEVFHFYAGDPVEMLQLRPDGGEIIIIGNDLAAGHLPQVVVPGSIWQGCRLVDGGHWALLGCTVAPGFDYADFDMGNQAALSAAYPEFADQIAALNMHYLRVSPV